LKLRPSRSAAKTVEAFTARLREEIDLDTLSAELLAVVDQTMRPTQASLWLRPSAQGLRSTTSWVGKFLGRDQQPGTGG
jgi:hypothetical protein